MFQPLKEKLIQLKHSFVDANWNRGIKCFFEKFRWFNIQLTTAFDITTTVHWSVPLFLIVFLFINPIKAGICAIAFLSVIPHEYGHALAARFYGIKTSRIVLYPLGGVAILIPNKDIKLEKVKELVVAAAGPVVSFMLAIFGFLMFWVTSTNLPEVVTIYDLGFWFWVCVVNVVMVLFNLIPAFPMDGGRMLRASLGLFTSHLRSTQYAYYCSVVFCACLGVWGLVHADFGLPFMMIVIHMLARIEYTQVKIEAGEIKIEAGEIVDLSDEKKVF